MENELRDLGRLDMFGLMKEDNDREKVMSEMDKIRAKSVYDHPSADCSDACKERGENNIIIPWSPSHSPGDINHQRIRLGIFIE